MEQTASQEDSHLSPSAGMVYSFPAIRGIQAGREYYVTMFPLKVLPSLFTFNDEELDPKFRAQRILNKNRIPEITRYIVDNPKDYVFSSITASIDSNVEFHPYMDKGEGRNIGQLEIPMGSRLLINDGQHRRAAIEEALKERPELGSETISVVLFVDSGLRLSQQMFADLNKHAVRPTRSLGILYDHRDPMAQLARDLAMDHLPFKGLTELEKTTISNRSTKIFTLSSVYQATCALLGKTSKTPSVDEDEADLAKRYWAEVAQQIPEWQLLLQKKVNASDLRRDFIHAHGVALQALGRVGATLIECYPDDWEHRLEPLSKLDWSRDNVDQWEGRALVGGSLSKAQNHLVLTTNAIKEHLGLPLDEHEQRIEAAFQRGEMD